MNQIQPISGLQAGKELAKLAHGRFTQIKLQKILYLAHAEHLVDHHVPLIKGGFLAWRHGPVCLGLYAAIERHRDRPVPLEAFDFIVDLNPEKHSSNYRTLHKTFEVFEHWSVGKLVEESKKGAWEKTLVNGKVEIQDDCIQQNNIKRFQ